MNLLLNWTAFKRSWQKYRVLTKFSRTRIVPSKMKSTNISSCTIIVAKMLDATWPCSIDCLRNILLSQILTTIPCFNVKTSLTPLERSSVRPTRPFRKCKYNVTKKNCDHHCIFEWEGKWAPELSKRVQHYPDSLSLSQPDIVRLQGGAHSSFSRMRKAY